MINATDLPTHETSSLRRPRVALIFAALLLAAAVFMALLGVSASAYFYSAVALILAAGLTFWGKGAKLLLTLNGLNQLSGIVLILILWLGDGLGVWKLNIAGAALLVNVLTGGPLMAVLGGLMVVWSRQSSPLHQWLHAA